MLDLLINVISPSLLSAIGWGLAPYFDKKGLKYLDNEYKLAFIASLIIKIILFGLITLILFFAINSKLKLFNKINTTNTKKAFGVLLISAILIIGANFYFLKALSNTKYTTLVVLITYILPVIITSIMSYILLNEEFNIGMIIGLIITILGILLFITQSKK